MEARCYPPRLYLLWHQGIIEALGIMVMRARGTRTATVAGVMVGVANPSLVAAPAATKTVIVSVSVVEMFATTVKLDSPVGVMTIAQTDGVCMTFAGLGEMAIRARGTRTATVAGVMVGVANPSLVAAPAATKTVIVSVSVVEMFATTVKLDSPVGVMTIAQTDGVCMTFAGLEIMAIDARATRTATVAGVMVGAAMLSVVGAPAATKTVIVSAIIVGAVIFGKPRAVGS